MNAELFYLVGKPNHIKQALVSQLCIKLCDEHSILVPEVFTTDEVIAAGDNYIHVEERDFHLRQSMGMYCLTWTKNNCFYAVGADLIQRLHTGIDVILNGSLHNLEEATKQFPNLNTVLVQKEGSIVREQSNRYLITEDDEVKLEWSDQETDLGHPYILTLQSEHSMDNAVDMLISLVTYEKSCLDKVV